MSATYTTQDIDKAYAAATAKMEAIKLDPHHTAPGLQTLLAIATAMKEKIEAGDALDPYDTMGQFQQRVERFAHTRGFSSGEVGKMRAESRFIMEVMAEAMGLPHTETVTRLTEIFDLPPVARDAGERGRV